MFRHELTRPAILRTATFKLTLAVVAAVVSGMILQFFLFYVRMVHFEADHTNAMLRQEFEVLARQGVAELVKNIDNRSTNELRVVIDWAGLFDPQLHHIAGDLKNWPKGLSVGGHVQALMFQPRGDAQYVMFFLSTRLPSGDILVLAKSLHVVAELHQMIRRAVLLSILPITAFALMTGIVLSRRALGRVKTMHESIDRIMRGDLQERLPAGRERDDLERLAGSVNRMLDRLERLMTEIRNVGNDIAHDLRTPLSRVRARFERAMAAPHDAEYLGRIISQATQDLDQCFSIITALLRIADIENGRRRAGFAWIDLGQIAADIIDLYEPIAETRNISLKNVVRGGDILIVYGDRDLIVEVLANLLDNAIKFTPEGGEVNVAVARGANEIKLSVADTGIGIPESEREAILGRFYRSDKSRHVPGNGLGLSLVVAILRLHDATLEVGGHPGRPSQNGCVFDIKFPIKPVGDVWSSFEA